MSSEMLKLTLLAGVCGCVVVFDFLWFNQFPPPSFSFKTYISVLKSESAEVYIPELQLELTSGTLGGKFTTVGSYLFFLLLFVMNFFSLFIIFLFSFSFVYLFFLEGLLLDVQESLSSNPFIRDGDSKGFSFSSFPLFSSPLSNPRFSPSSPPPPLPHNRGF